VNREQTMEKAMLITGRRSKGPLTVPLGVFLLVTFAACGYQLQDRGLSAPEGVQTIAVPILENRTSETGLETVFTNDLAYEFTRSKVLQLVDKAQADAVLRGIIRSIKDTNIAYNAEFGSAERRVRIALGLTLVRRDGRVLWSNAAVSDQEPYRVVESKQITDGNKRAALDVMSKRLAERIHNQILEAF